MPVPDAENAEEKRICGLSAEKKRSAIGEKAVCRRKKYGLSAEKKRSVGGEKAVCRRKKYGLSAEKKRSARKIRRKTTLPDTRSAAL